MHGGFQTQTIEGDIVDPKSNTVVGHTLNGVDLLDVPVSGDEFAARLASLVTAPEPAYEDYNALVGDVDVAILLAEAGALEGEATEPDALASENLYRITLHVPLDEATKVFDALRGFSYVIQVEKAS